MREACTRAMRARRGHRISGSVAIACAPLLRGGSAPSSSRTMDRNAYRSSSQSHGAPACSRRANPAPYLVGDPLRRPGCRPTKDSAKPDFFHGSSSNRRILSADRSDPGLSSCSTSTGASAHKGHRIASPSGFEKYRRRIGPDIVLRWASSCWLGPSRPCR